MLSEKKLARIEKALGKDTLAELEALAEGGLRSKVVEAEASVKVASDELEANDKYQSLKESLKAISSGLSDVKKRQRNIVQYSLHLLEEKGVK